MSHTYRRVHDLLLEKIRQQFGLGEPDAMLILGDVLANLEALVADLVPREDLGLDPGRSPGRLLDAIETIAAQLDCAPLADLLAEARAAQGPGLQPLPDAAVGPLQRFAAGLRKAAPDIPREITG